MRREAGAEGGQEDPVGGAEAVVHDLLEGEEDRGGGHVAVAGQDVPGREKFVRGDIQFPGHSG